MAPRAGVKIVWRYSPPLTAVRRVSLIVTEVAVIEPAAMGSLREREPHGSVDRNFGRRPPQI